MAFPSPCPKRVLFALLTISLLLSVGAGAQDVWSLVWGSAEDEKIHRNIPAPDGGQLLAGARKGTERTDWDGYAAMVNENGVLQWEKVYGDGSDDVFYDAAAAQGGGYYLAGYSHSYGTVSGGLWVVRIDAAGQVIWQNTYDGDSLDWGYSVCPATGGGCYVGGLTYSFGPSNKNAMVLRLDASGAIVWQKAVGGPRDDWAYRVTEATGGGVIAVGMTDGFSASQYDAWAFNLSADGQTLEWANTYGGSKWEYFYFVIPASAGGYMAVGAQGGTGGSDYDLWGVRLAEDGSVTWERALGRPRFIESANGVAETQDGGFVLAGISDGVTPGSYDAWLVQLDSAGSLRWQRAYGGSSEDRFSTIQPMPDGGFLAAGRTASQGAGNLDFWASRVNANGAQSTTCISNEQTHLSDDTTNPSVDPTPASLVTADYDVSSVVDGADSVTHLSNLCISPCRITCSAGADPTQGMEPLSVAFTALGEATDCVGEITYSWVFGDGTDPASGADATHIYEHFGSYNWSVTVEAEGFLCYQSGQIEVVERHCVLGVTGSASPTSGHAPLNVTLNALSTAVDCLDTVSYDWDFGDGTPHGFQPEVVHAYYDPGTYAWSVTAAADGYTAVDTGTIVVDVPPCTINCAATVGSEGGLLPLSVSFFGAAVPSASCEEGVSFEWDFGDGSSSEEASTSHDYATPGTLNWTLTASADGSICTKTGTLLLIQIPGDYDIDGTVTIGEVQRSINMFLGLEPSEPSSDCDASGTMSIGEVQRVINNFLGISSTCWGS